MVLIRFLSRLFGGRGVPDTPVDQGRAALLQQGLNTQRAGNAGQAEYYFRTALEKEPADAEAAYALGKALAQRGQWQEAVNHLKQAIAIQPGLADAHAALGNVYLLDMKIEAAISSYQEALRLAPHNAVAHSNVGLAYQAVGQHANALSHFERAYALLPELPGLIRNLTLEWIALEQFDTAQSRLHALLQRTPEHFEWLCCAGFVLQKMHCPEQALELYRRARSQNGHDAELLNNLGIVLQDLGRLNEALECYERALAANPDFALAKWHRSLVHLLQHDFVRGWADYDLRALSVDQPPRPATYPTWNGGDLSAQGLLVYAEQGLGDEIMFASCLPQAIAASRHCVIECSPKLEALFRRSFPSALVYPTTSRRDFPQIVREAQVSTQIAMGSLPRYLRRSLVDFPRHAGYLQADPLRVAYWQERLAALGPGYKVGISWQGGTLKTRRSVRSIPLREWQPLLRTPGVTFVNLQYTDSQADLAELAALGIQVVDFPEVRDSYDDTAALVCALDQVISVCTAVIHLGGALGKPVWVLAPFSPEWRYGIAGDSMPWYPSVRLWRQPVYGDWAAVLTAAAAALKARVDEMTP